MEKNIDTYCRYNSRESVGELEKFVDNFIYNHHGTSNFNKSICGDIVGCYHDTKSGYIGIMCPRCFDYDIIKRDIIVDNYSYEQVSTISKSSITTMVNVDCYGECPNCGMWQHFIEIDPNIVRAISVLNRKGYYTKYCCEGHYNGNIFTPYIYFTSLTPIDDITKAIDTLPLSWDIDLDDLTNGNIVIRTFSDCSDYNKEAIYDITEWAESLPIRRSIKLTTGPIYGRCL